MGFFFFFNLRDISYTEERPRREWERRKDLFGGKAAIRSQREKKDPQRRVSQLQKSFKRVPVA